MVLVDRLTGYIMAEKTPNKGTDSAIAVVKNWSLLFGSPMRIISDDGPAYRNDFRAKLNKLKIKHKNSSCYHPESNSLAERAIGSLKRSLRRSPKTLTPTALREVIFQINQNIAQDMTGSANERFLLRSVRGDMPNSINNEIKPLELIHRRIMSHENRIKGKNKNKSIYPVGTRVRLQNSKSKLFDTKGIIVEPRWTDNSEVVSYIIRTDSGLVTSRHRKFLKVLHPTNDPTNYENITNLDTADDILADRNASSDDTATATATDQAEEIGKRRNGLRSDNIKRHTITKKISSLRSLRVNKVRISQTNPGVKMGASCSTKLQNAQEEIKILKEKLSRQEGHADQSIRASQTNIGLFNLASEENEECGCANASSGGGMITIIEGVAIFITAIIVFYMAYRCCIKIRARRKEEKERSRERRRMFIRREMENTKPGDGKQSLAIEMGSQNSGEPDRLYIPRYHNTEKDTANKGTQDSVTFE